MLTRLKHLYNICAMLGQRWRCWDDIGQMLCERFVFSRNPHFVLHNSTSLAIWHGFPDNMHIKKHSTQERAFSWSMNSTKI